MWGEVHFNGMVDAMIRESCLVHTRILLDFFYPRINPEKSKYEDVFVTDYLPDRCHLPPEFQKLLVEPAWLRDYRDQLDWRLAHLTMRRMRFKKNPAWCPERQFEHLERLIAGFLAALPPTRRALFNPNQQ
jgi:hypothetical protein